MKRIVTILGLALLAAQPLTAQENAGDAATEAAPETPVTESEAGTEQPQTEPQEPEQAEAQEQPQAEAQGPREEIRATFTDWQQVCEVGTENCYLYQLGKDQDGNSVAEVSIVKLPGGQEAVAGMTIVTPLPTLLSRKLQMQVDTGKAVAYDYDFCTPAGCFVRRGLTNPDLDSLKRGAAAKLQLFSVADPGKPVDVTVSLAGFTAAWTAIPSLQQ